MEQNINNLVDSLTNYSNHMKLSESEMVRMNTLCSELITEVYRTIQNKAGLNAQTLNEIDSHLTEAIHTLEEVQRRFSFQTLESDFNTGVQQEHLERLRELERKVSTLRANYLSNG